MNTKKLWVKQVVFALACSVLFMAPGYSASQLPDRENSNAGLLLAQNTETPAPAVEETAKEGVEEEEDPVIELDKRTYGAGEEITVHFKAPIKIAYTAWVGIVPADTPHHDEMINDKSLSFFEYLDGRTKGPIYLQAPNTSGKYDVRLYSSDTGGKELGSLTFTVE